ncbi:MAG: hypothetical protein ABSH06_25625 [Thermodesulfobacteriota bacterium]
MVLFEKRLYRMVCYHAKLLGYEIIAVQIS